ncbi:AbrB/MazE/SpoVT family DNA-binding domain-containing protein [Puniceicoccus vermicola]|uniref:Sporulation regulator n=1 Tax=Puniceicoccus vermicola TaxID=388746 RepID=A0A7X1E4I1_9BACT|nr:sporulation regulator [Puniceicoccus vermicola]MBC2602570.1 sporulation regulator [Puniceicoccus vermicola]
MKTLTCTLTKRGQISVPASIRKDLGLRPGQRLRWEKIAGGECRVTVEQEGAPGPLAALGFGPKLRGDDGKATSDWMKELREGE